jgi:phosphoglycolate phosphatase
MARALVFDLDGTLVDSLPDIAAALAAALAEHAIAAPSLDTVRGWIGGGARALIGHAVAPALVEPVFARFLVHYAAAPVAHTRLYPGLGPVLDRLARSCTLAVLSNKPHELTLQIAAALLAPWPFAVIVGAHPGVPLKPDPRAALAVAAQLDVAPGACTLIGDAPSDVATAQAAGMQAIAVAWGYRPRAELAAAGPAWIADAPAALLALA